MLVLIVCGRYEATEDVVRLCAEAMQVVTPNLKHSEMHDCRRTEATNSDEENLLGHCHDRGNVDLLSVDYV